MKQKQNITPLLAAAGLALTTLTAPAIEEAYKADQYWEDAAQFPTTVTYAEYSIQLLGLSTSNGRLHVGSVKKNASTLKTNFNIDPGDVDFFDSSRLLLYYDAYTNVGSYSVLFYMGKATNDLADDSRLTVKRGDRAEFILRAGENIYDVEAIPTWREGDEIEPVESDANLGDDRYYRVNTGGLSAGTRDWLAKVDGEDNFFFQYLELEIETPTRIISTGPDLNFGDVDLGKSASLSMAISNTGNSDLQVSSISYPAQFSGPTGSFTLAPSDRNSVEVTYTPAAEGPAGGTITVVSNSTSGDPNAACSGFGATRITRLTPPGGLDFGFVPVDSSETQDMIIHNDGNRALIISSITPPDGYKVTATLPMTIDTGGNRIVPTTFLPIETATYSGAITIASDMTSGNTALDATGVGEIVEKSIIRLEPCPIDFGKVAVGTSASRVVTFHNDGTSPLNISAVSTPSGFSGNWSGPIAPSGSQAVTVTFTPNTTGTHTGVLQVDSDANEGAGTCQIQGTGYEIAVAALRNLPTAASPGSSVTVMLEVTESQSGLPAMILREKLPAGWTISNARWLPDDVPFMPTLIGGEYRWLFNTFTNRPVTSGTIEYTATIPGEVFGPQLFEGSCAYVQEGEVIVPTLGDTELDMVDRSQAQSWIDDRLSEYPIPSRTLTADPDGDQLSNLLEYLCGMDPAVPDSLPMSIKKDASGQWMEFGMKLRGNDPQIAITLLLSQDLQSWDRVSTGRNGATWSTNSDQLTVHRANDQLDGFWEVTFREPAGPQKRFVTVEAAYAP